jgi:hypothetical protein
MNLIQIEGPDETVRGLIDVPDMILVLVSTDRLADGRVRTAAYATDRAIGEIEARGATVERLLDNEQVDEQVAAVFERFEPPVG